MGQETITHADGYAAEFEAINEAIIEAIANASPEAWQCVTAREEWPVGVVAHHVSQVQRFATDLLTKLAAADTEPVALTGAFVEENNARHAAEFAGVGKDETLAALRANGSALATAIRDLNDEQFLRVAMVFDGQDMTADQAVMSAVIGHFREHLGSIQETFG